jgi:hypothetical protein
MTADLEKAVKQTYWEAWGQEQQLYVLTAQFTPVDDSRYKGKRWELDKARPSYAEFCPRCFFLTIVFMPCRAITPLETRMSTT